MSYVFNTQQVIKMFIFFDLPQDGLKYLSTHKGMTMEELCILIFFFCSSSSKNLFKIKSFFKFILDLPLNVSATEKMFDNDKEILEKK